MLLAAALLLLQHTVMRDMALPEKNPYTAQADLEQGKKLYGGRCAGCHGPAGDGGKGTNLAVPALPRAASDAALYRIIRYGIPETEMPGHNMTAREIWQMAAFVRTLGQDRSGRIKGDAGRGSALVRGKGGCLQCHTLDGEGGHLGPSLTGIGKRRSPSYLKAKLVEPDKDLASGFSIVKLTTRKGEKITAVKLNEDTWSIQVRDMNSRLHSFWKDDLNDLAVERRTLMPSYATQLTAQELDDIVAFLVATGGHQ